MTLTGSLTTLFGKIYRYEALQAHLRKLVLSQQQYIGDLSVENESTSSNPLTISPTIRKTNDATRLVQYILLIKQGEKIMYCKTKAQFLQ